MDQEAGVDDEFQEALGPGDVLQAKALPNVRLNEPHRYSDLGEIVFFCKQ